MASVEQGFMMEQDFGVLLELEVKKTLNNNRVS